MRFLRRCPRRADNALITQNPGLVVVREDKGQFNAGLVMLGVGSGRNPVGTFFIAKYPGIVTLGNNLIPIFSRIAEVLETSDNYMVFRVWEK